MSQTFNPICIYLNNTEYILTSKSPLELVETKPELKETEYCTLFWICLFKVLPARCQSLTTAKMMVGEHLYMNIAEKVCVRQHFMDIYFPHLV